MRQLPNLITVLRLLLIPVMAFLVFARSYDLAFLLFVLQAVSDWLDGFLARRYHLMTRFGAILDPIADKLAMLAATLLLAWQGFLPWWLAAVMVARDIVIVCGALAYHCLVDRVDMAPTRLSKLNTFVEFSVLAIVLADAAAYFEAEDAMPLLFIITLATVAFSGAHYVWLWSRKALENAHRPAGRAR